MFLLEARQSTGAIITIVLSLLSLTNMPFPHMARARFMQPYTIFFALVWIGGIAVGTFAYPHHYLFVKVMLIVGSVYFFALSGLRALHDHRARQAGTDARADVPERIGVDGA